MRLLVDDLRAAGGVRDDLPIEVAADTIWVSVIVSDVAGATDVIRPSPATATT